MTPEEYAWNQHERMEYIHGTRKNPTPYKLKIEDDLALRLELEELLEQMPQARLAIWARKNAEQFLTYLDIGNLTLQLEILQTISKALEERVSGQLSAYELRQAVFLANSLSKESRTEVSRLAAKIYAQAIATGHMRGHDIVSTDYAIKLINVEHPKNPEKVIEERRAQIALVKSMTSETP